MVDTGRMDMSLHSLGTSKYSSRVKRSRDDRWSRKTSMNLKSQLGRIGSFSEVPRIVPRTLQPPHASIAKASVTSCSTEDDLPGAMLMASVMAEVKEH